MTPAPTSLDRLHDIVVPASVPWWPPAPGWYWVLGFVLVLALWLLGKSFIRWQRNRYRREARAELARQEIMLRDPACRAAALTAVAELLKRTALTAFPREEVATLTGSAWLEFLNRTGRTIAFTEGNGAVLEYAAYDPRTVAALEESKLNEIVSLVRGWIAHHDSEIEHRATKEAKRGPTNYPSLPSYSSGPKAC